MLKFEQIEINNFRAFKHVQLNLDSQGLVILLGVNKDVTGDSSNGAAKSSIFYAILWAIYGQIPESSSSDSIINNQVGKDTSVKLDLKIGSTNLHIERYRKDSKNKNKILLFVNKKEQTQPTNKATDAKILEYVGIDMETLLNSVMFGTKKVVDFASATDKERKHILEDLSHISIYRVAQQQVKDLRKDANSKLIELNNKLNSINTKEQAKRSLLSSYKLQLNDRENSLKKYQKDLQELKEDLKSLNYDDLVVKNKSLNLKLKELEQKGKSVSYTDTTKLSSKLNALKNSMDNFKSQGAELIQLMKSDKDEIVKVKNSKAVFCKLCGSRLDENHKQKELANLLAEIKKSKDEFDNVKVKYLKAKEEYNPLEKQLETIQAKNKSLETYQNQLRRDYKNLYEEKTKVSNSLNSYKFKLDSFKHALKDYNELKAKQIPKPDIEEHDFQQQIKDLNSKIDSLSLDIKDYDELVKVFGNNGVKYHVLNLAVPYINEKMQEYMDILSGGTLNAYISQGTKSDGTKTDKLGIGIQSVTTADSFEDLSSGEKKRVSLALNIAFLSYLSSTIGGINIAVFDEIFDSLDSSGINNAIKLLKKLSSKIGSIFVISHNSDLKYNDNFDKSLVVEKSNGFSKILN